MKSIPLILPLMALPISGQAEKRGNVEMPQCPNVVFIYADDIGYGDLSCKYHTHDHQNRQGHREHFGKHQYFLHRFLLPVFNHNVIAIKDKGAIAKKSYLRHFPIWEQLFNRVPFNPIRTF